MNIENHFDYNIELENQLIAKEKIELLEIVKSISEYANIYFIRQKEALGLGHAILTGQTLIGDEPFAVILPDDLCDNNNDSVLTQMVKLYEKYPNNCIVAVEEVEKLIK